jgi:hypothetical protein
VRAAVALLGLLGITNIYAMGFGDISALYIFVGL